MTIVIAGGGTGGHIFPGLAIAQKIKKLKPEIKLIFIGTKKGIEFKLVPKYNFKLKTIKITGFKGKNLKNKIYSFLQLPLAILKSIKILHKLKAKKILGVGGYASAPVIIAAILLRKPFFLCEQNSIPGFTNKLLSYFAIKIFGSFEYSRQFFPGKKFILSGNPLRDGFNVKKNIKYNNIINILILGGSQGAHILNNCMPQTLKLLQKKNQIKLEHQTGKKEFKITKKKYEKLNLAVNIKIFINDILSSYKKADLVICRSGATTCAEISALCLPAILVPFSSAVYDHQTLNAYQLVKLGTAILLPEHELTPEKLSKTISNLILNSNRLKLMNKKAQQLNSYNASEKIALELMN